MPYELLPMLHKRHIRSDEWVEARFHKRDGIIYRNYVRKSFYRMPTVLRVDKFYIETHDVFYKRCMMLIKYTDTILNVVLYFIIITCINRWRNMY